MNIAIVTNIRAPYRKLQIEEFSKMPNIDINVYYTNKNVLGRKWDVEPIQNVNEIVLKGYKLFKKYGYINFGLTNIVKSNDVIIIGGYEQPAYILLSFLARLHKKPYVIIFDGISPSKIDKAENPIKFLLKRLVIEHASAIFGNGSVSKLYFSKKFNYNTAKIFNQYLTVDIEKIINMAEEKEFYREKVRLKYDIDNDKKIILYSGRLIKQKNIDLIIKAVSSLENKDEYVLLILGDGEERQYLIGLAKQLDIVLKITGFISSQEELFKHYFAGDVLILPSLSEAWGLVVNEAMAAGLAVIVSDECGCSLDLVKNSENGYIVKAGNVEDMKNSIEKIFEDNNYKNYGVKSREIINEWNFKNSRLSFEKMLKKLKALEN